MSAAISPLNQQNEPRHRAMTLKDIDAVVKLEQSAYPFPWASDVFKDCLRVGYGARVVEVNQTLVGYAIYSHGAGEAHLLNLCVAQAYRRQKIARRLLRYVIQTVAIARAEVLFLEVRPSNVAGLRLYESLGFEFIGLRKGYYEAVGGREDARVYRLKLTAWT